MSTLAEMLRDTTTLEPAESEWLHLLAGDWQLVSDLSFADLVLWVRGGMDGWRAVAHVRPNTGPMVFYDDIVGSSSSRSRASMLDEAARSRRIVAKAVPTIREDMSIREDAVPVVHGDRTIAVVTRHANLTGGRTPSRLELTYRDLADSIMRMVAAGEFPSTASPTGMRRGAPRVGDGVIHLDAEGLVKYASPNAVSAVHRMGHVGDVIGEVLAKVVTDLVSRNGANVDESLAVVATGRAAWRSEVETTSATITMRAIPLTLGGVRTGAMVLVRDVSELRRREQELLTKDATIREIHHRVKNNLQTVASLLRLQARRTNNAEGREALIESVRRVSSIALVHDALSMSVDEEVNLDGVVDRILPMMNDVATVDTPIRISKTGDFGVLDADRATALVMVITELVQNAIEHAFDGTTEAGEVTIHAERSARWLDVVVHDDGRGLPDGFSLEKADRLGLQIVRTLVSAELDGSLGMHAGPTGGTDVVLRVPIGRRARLAQ